MSLPKHPDLLAAAVRDPDHYAGIQAQESAWSRGTPYGDRAVATIRDVVELLTEKLKLPRGLGVCVGGCNDGLEVEEWTRQGYVACGFDLDPEKVRVARYCGLDVRVGDLADPAMAGFTEGAFAIVYAAHCLEHARDLAGACRGLASLVEPGGLLVVVVPLGSDNNAHAPAHVTRINEPPQIYQHFTGWQTLDPIVRGNPGPEALLFLRKPEEGG